MRFTAFITCILILLSISVPVYALSTAERRQDGVIIVRTVNLTPTNENAAESRTAPAEEKPEKSKKIDEPCGMSEEELEEALKHELKQYAGDFLSAEEKHGVNAAFLAAIAAQESGWGRYCFRENNIFGFGKKSFDSVPECIDYVAEYIAKHYISENGKYYHGKTVEGVSVCWCDEDWAKRVNYIFDSILEGK